MKYLGSKTLVTDRLILRAQCLEEQRKLWEILMIPEVNKYFLTAPSKIKEKLKDWNIQKPFYEEKIKYASDNNVFEWSIFLKDTDICIGRITCQEGSSDNDDIRDIGWIIDPQYQRKGYATEAARKVLDYMFNECEIKSIKTSAAICNQASWKTMERLGFIRQNYTKYNKYTYLDNEVEAYVYVLDKNNFKKDIL